MKKILLGIGTIATVVAPVASIVACGSSSQEEPTVQKPSYGYDDYVDNYSTSLEEAKENFKKAHVFLHDPSGRNRKIMWAAKSSYWNAPYCEHFWNTREESEKEIKEIIKPVVTEGKYSFHMRRNDKMINESTCETSKYFTSMKTIDDNEDLSSHITYKQEGHPGTKGTNSITSISTSQPGVTFETNTIEDTSIGNPPSHEYVIEQAGSKVDPKYYEYTNKEFPGVTFKAYPDDGKSIPVLKMKISEIDHSHLLPTNVYQVYADGATVELGRAQNGLVKSGKSVYVHTYDGDYKFDQDSYNWAHGADHEGKIVNWIGSFEKNGDIKIGIGEHPLESGRIIFDYGNHQESIKVRGPKDGSPVDPSLFKFNRKEGIKEIPDTRKTTVSFEWEGNVIMTHEFDRKDIQWAKDNIVIRKNLLEQYDVFIPEQDYKIQRYWVPRVKIQEGDTYKYLEDGNLVTEKFPYSINIALSDGENSEFHTEAEVDEWIDEHIAKL